MAEPKRKNWIVWHWDTLKECWRKLVEFHNFPDGYTSARDLAQSYAYESNARCTLFYCRYRATPAGRKPSGIPQKWRGNVRA